MEINLRHDYSEDICYFTIDTPDNYICSSDFMAKKLNMTKKDFKEMLTSKVIKHDDFSIYTDGEGEDSLFFDITFKPNDISDATYINRFKEAFAPQLMLISLGGVNQ